MSINVSQIYVQWLVCDKCYYLRDPDRYSDPEFDNDSAIICPNCAGGRLDLKEGKVWDLIVHFINTFKMMNESPPLSMGLCTKNEGEWTDWWFKTAKLFESFESKG
jgi:hypothetical protein